MTTRSSGVSWYELLGVEPDATPEQIKAAWREATDKFEPGQGSGQFRLFNEAADVLLDPDRRAEYDASRAADSVAEVRGAPGPSLETFESVPELEESEPESEPEFEPEPAPVSSGTPIDVSASSAPPTHDTGEGSSVGRRVLAIVGLVVLALVAAGLAGTALFLRNQNGQVSGRDDAGDAATAAAERALPAVLSYDYRHLDADRDQAVKFLSKRYGREYSQTFQKLIASEDGQPGPAAQAKAVVKASVEDTGVSSASEQRVQLVVFLNQTTAKGDAAPTLSLNRLTVSMVKSGNSWLVDRIDSY